ncbi:metal-sulfur cluster assembly factor (plasmid) [Halobaculum sp. CBA1158]|uniref:metal-sulfur cluster assembly factor n=1 Tax=Halobaculum sp. CBA1158 TaxID=2904243 RepID=UPI001F24F2F1|nr:metal-sulfur cluster assembly factor [Halobaculum sp. CBA1158]UIP01492.1 metal-sulfur cluster assembly factor [Halobaculum sp. CBA1158]
MSTQNVRVSGSGIAADGSVSEIERRLVERIDAEVMDPHIPVSLVEMGMIYDVRYDAGDVTVDMTYPCMGCPAYQMLQDDIEESLRGFDEVDDVSIEVVWDPVWSKDRLDEEVQQKLRESGTAI